MPLNWAGIWLVAEDPSTICPEEAQPDTAPVAKENMQIK